MDSALNSKKLSLKDVEVLLKGGHAYNEHIRISKTGCVKRLTKDCLLSKKYGIASRFLSEELAIKVVKAVLQTKANEVECARREAVERRITVTATLNRVIGEGWAANTDWNKSYPMNRVAIIIQFDEYFRHFFIVTAYPLYNEKVYEEIRADRRNFILSKRS